MSLESYVEARLRTLEAQTDRQREEIERLNKQAGDFREIIDALKGGISYQLSGIMGKPYISVDKNFWKSDSERLFNLLCDVFDLKPPVIRANDDVRIEWVGKEEISE